MPIPFEPGGTATKPPEVRKAMANFRREVAKAQLVSHPAPAKKQPRPAAAPPKRISVPGPAAVKTRTAPILSAEQFKAVRPQGSYRKYAAFVARRRGAPSAAATVEESYRAGRYGLPAERFRQEGVSPGPTRVRVVTPQEAGRAKSVAFVGAVAPEASALPRLMEYIETLRKHGNRPGGPGGGTGFIPESELERAIRLSSLSGQVKPATAAQAATTAALPEPSRADVVRLAAESAAARYVAPIAADAAARSNLSATFQDMPLLPKALAQFTQALYYTPAGLYQLARHPIGTAKAIPGAIAEDFRHPLRNPGYLAMDAWAAASLGAGVAAKAGAAARAGSVRGALSTVIRPLNTGLRELDTGAVVLEPRSALPKALSRLARSRGVTKVGEKTAKVGRERAWVREIVAEIQAAPAAALRSRSGRTVTGRKKIGMDVGEALRAVANQTPLEARIARYEASLETVKKAGTRRGLEKRRAAALAAKERGLVEVIPAPARIAVESQPVKSRSFKRPDWADEFESMGNKIDGDGTVLLYHATTKGQAEQILRDGKLRRPADAPDSYGVYLGSTKQVAESYGDGTVLPVRVRVEDLLPDDVFPGRRMDFSIPTRGGEYRPVAVGERALRPPSEAVSLSESRFETAARSLGMDDAQIAARLEAGHPLVAPGGALAELNRLERGSSERTTALRIALGELDPEQAARSIDIPGRAVAGAEWEPGSGRLVGGETAAPGLYYIPETMERTYALGPLKFGAKTIGVPRYPFSRKPRTGKATSFALSDVNAVKVMAEHELATTRYSARLQTWKQALAESVSATELVDMLERQQLSTREVASHWRGARVKPGTTTPATRTMFDRLLKGTESISLDDLRAYAADADSAGQIRFFDNRRIGAREYRGSTPTAIGTVADTFNQLAKISLLFTKPGYVPPNLAGQIGMMLVHQPVRHFLDAITIRSSRILRQLSPEQLATLRAASGQGMARSVAFESGPSAAVNRAYQGAAGAYSKILDQPFRDRVALTEAWNKGYVNAADVKRLLAAAPDMDTAKPLAQWSQEAKDLLEIRMRTDEALGRFGRMSEIERTAVMRVVFFWPWLKASTRYAARLPIEHPAKTAGLVQIGRQGQEETYQQLGEEVAKILQGVFPIGETGEGLPRVVQPLAAAVLSGPAELLNVIESELGEGKADAHIGEYVTPAISAVAGALGFDAFRRRRIEGPIQERLAGQVRDLSPYTQLAERLREPGVQEGRLYGYSTRDALAQVLLGSTSPRTLNPETAEKIVRAQLEPVQRRLRAHTDFRTGLLQAARQAGFDEKQLPAEIREAITWRAKKAAAYAAAEKAKDGALSQYEALEVEVRLLAKAKRLTAREVRDMLAEFKTAAPEEVESIRGELAPLFGADALSEFLSLVNDTRREQGLEPLAYPQVRRGS